ncbi:DUF2845 domain-containing protein [Pseudomonas sp. DR 5-09]|uniref:DUF2845 domain-containing protein n=1 Tax=Pseudomonas sp. DR 5-09 TaxID=1534110 RepID=UPI0007DD0ECF|nr:DUF2845 domain-containing protein [Pseudomonas sp. DR 5-09]ANI56659.1 hypothetical protein PDR5_49290 [Pseudomonas sp. DR 5-09]
MNPKWLAALGLVFLASQAAASDTLRCGSQLVSLGDRASEVLQKCGEPVGRDLLGFKRSANRREEFQVEEWTYGPNNGMYQYLRFEGNRLKQINSKRGN